MISFDYQNFVFEKAAGICNLWHVVKKSFSFTYLNDTLPLYLNK
jgi:hypothetical protein